MNILLCMLKHNINKELRFSNAVCHNSYCYIDQHPYKF